MSDRLRCRHCGDVIGVYEPLIALTDGQPRETSRALELSNPNHASSRVCYHRACFERLAAEACQEPTSELSSDSRP